MKDRALLICIFSFVFGIFVSSFVFISPVISLFTFLVGVGIVAAQKIYERRIPAEVIFLFLAIIFFGLGALRYAIKDFHELRAPLNEGVITSEPEKRDNVTRFVFQSDNKEKVLVSTNLYAEVEYGDRVRVEGKFERPGVIASDSGRDFDYKKFLAKDDIYYTLNFAEVEVLGSGEGNALRAALLEVKKSFLERIRATFSEPYASLLSGLLLAGKDAMPKDILEEFRRAGIVHIVVLSGYNITIIAEFLRRIFEKAFLFTKFAALPAVASGASIIGIIFFVLMTGAEATVVRAALMVLTVIVAKMMGRNYSAPRALLLAGFVMLLENPKILVFDPSFQLSFLATLALIYVVPVVERYLSFITDRYTLRTTLATTISTQITVLPLLVYSMGDISLISLPANILVLLIIPYTMLLGFVSTLLAYLSGFVALPFAYVTHLLLAWILQVSNFFGNMGFASISVTKFSFAYLIIVYLLMAIVVWKKRPRRKAGLPTGQEFSS